MRSMVRGASPPLPYRAGDPTGRDAPSVTTRSRRATFPASQGRRTADCDRLDVEREKG